MFNEITILNKSTKESILMDYTKSVYALGIVDFGEIIATHNQYNFLNQVGSKITDTRLNNRPVMIQGWIVNPSLNVSLLQQRKNLLSDFIDPRNEYDIYVNGYILTFKPDNTIDYSTVDAENNEAICKFVITGTAANPLFKNENETVVSGANLIAKWIFPWTIIRNETIMSEREKSTIMYVQNNSNLEVGININIKVSGTVENPTLTNLDTLEFFKLDKIMNIGEEFEVNTNDGFKSVKLFTNGIESNGYKYKNIDSTWIKLKKGMNIFRRSADSGEEFLELEIKFSEYKLEVT